MQRCDEWLRESSFAWLHDEFACTVLLRIDRAPGFGGSSRIAMGKEAVSGEDRRGHQNSKQTGKTGFKGSRIIKKVFCYT
jgi:hypothetical protein